MGEETVVVSRRQMRGSAPERRTFHRPSCPSLKTRHRLVDEPDTILPRATALEAGYKPCERCRP
jgi:methylphosphotriester-DNA--protein-cysteine methyltransferase